jgi:D-beta-D-heptose 7-phosphate kinase/D-beta-D-heptose 1-phosphate adenosyltransferase
MLDTFFYGETNRISPEAPIPVLHVKRHTETLGGAGNVISNIRSLMGKADLISVIGKDVSGDKVLNFLENIGCYKGLVIETDEVPTIQKNRFVAKDQQLLRADFEELKPFSKIIEDKIISNTIKAMDSCDVLILSDYNKGVLSDKVIKSLITEANKRKIITIVDPKGHDYSIYKGATLVTPNKKELQEATNLSTETDEEVIEAAKYLIKKCGIKNVVATRSEKGITLVETKGAVHHAHAKVKEVYDVSGAGDTVVATLGLCLANKASLAEAVSLANLAGNVVVGKIGTATVSINELESLLESEENSKSQTRKWVSQQEAKNIIHGWKQEKYKIGFANGCYDLLHPGHISLIEQAKAACDKLVMALNTDASVQRLKGPSRPIKNESARATVMAALHNVDLVVLFDEDTPLELIKLLQPDILFKGADYTIDKVVGADIVQKNGGEVILIPLEPDQSTSNYVKKIKS